MKAPKQAASLTVDEMLLLQKTERFKMPCPRLQLTWFKVGDSWYHKRCTYTIVLPLQEHDIRRDFFDVKLGREYHALLSSTEVTGGRDIPPDAGETPWRDGMHAQWDSFTLKLPAYAVCENHATKLAPVEVEL